MTTLEILGTIAVLIMVGFLQAYYMEVKSNLKVNKKIYQDISKGDYTIRKISKIEGEAK